MEIHQPFEDEFTGTVTSISQGTGITLTPNPITDTGTVTNNLSIGISGGQTAIGGTGITDILKLQGTTGNGTLTSPAVQFLVGNNGATVAGTFLNNGNLGIGTTTPAYPLDVNGYARVNRLVAGAYTYLEEGTLYRVQSGNPIIMYTRKADTSYNTNQLATSVLELFLQPIFFL